MRRGRRRGLRGAAVARLGRLPHEPGALGRREVEVLGAALAACTFLVTCSIMAAVPIWEPSLGFPALSPAGQFLVKDIALLGIALVLLAEAVERNSARAAG